MIALRRGAFVTLLLLALVPSTAHAQTAALTLDALRNATYPVEAVPGKVAALKDGHFEVAAAPGSSSKATVDLVTATVGTVNGGPAAAVVLASSGGGSGVFFRLYALDATGQVIAKDALGDRIKVQSLTINAVGHIVVELLVHGPNEPLASATLPQHREYFVGNTLVRVDVPAPSRTRNAGLDGAQHTSVTFELILLAMLLGAIGVTRALGRTRRQ